MKSTIALALLAGAALSGTAKAVVFPENDTGGGNGSKSLANTVALTASGDTITGSHASTGDLDYFRVTSAPATAGIYFNRLTLSGASRSRMSVRGTNTGGTGDTAFTNDRFTSEFVGWYSFGNTSGNNGQMYVRTSVGGSSGSFGAYTMTYAQSAVTPISTSTYNQGTFTFTAGPGSFSDNEIYIYDSSFNLIGQNDVPQSGADANVNISLTTNGSYYIAIGTANSATNNPGNGTGTPATNPFWDLGVGGTARTNILDFPGVVARPQGLGSASAQKLRVFDGTTTTDFNATSGTGAFEMTWYQVNIIPAPSALALLGLGGLVAGRRRR